MSKDHRAQINQALQKIQQVREARDPSQKPRKQPAPRKNKKPGELTATPITYVASLLVIWGCTAPALKVLGLQWKALAMVDTPVAGFVMAGFGLVAMVIDVLSEGWIARGIAIVMLICGFFSTIFFLPKKKDDGWRPATREEIVLHQLDEDRAEQILRDRERLTGQKLSGREYRMQLLKTSSALASRRREIDNLELKVDRYIQKIAEARQKELQSGRAPDRSVELEIEYQAFQTRFSVLEAWPYTLDEDLIHVKFLNSTFPPPASDKIRQTRDRSTPDVSPWQYYWDASLPMTGVKFKFSRVDTLQLIAPWFTNLPQKDNVVARDGYAVGGFHVKIEDIDSPFGVRIRAFQVVFMRLQGDALNTADTYTSEWFGEPGNGTVYSLLSDGRIVAGLAAHPRGFHLARLGLIFRKPLDQVAGQ